MTSKPAQILLLKPAAEIVFEGPFDHVVTSFLELRNPTNNKRVCFKVKTTAPKRYCVRPNSGIVDPGKTVKIAIMLQPADQDIESERGRHKFMVQSAVVSGEVDLEQVWFKVSPSSIMDSKLRCVFQSTKTPLSAAAATASSDPSQISGGAPQGGASADAEQMTQPTDQDSNARSARDTQTAGRESVSHLDSDYQSSSAPWTGGSSAAARASQKANQSTDFTLVYVALLMLIVGVLLGKFLI